MSTRYGDRGFGRYGDSDEGRTEDRDYEERDAGRAYGDAGERYGRGSDYAPPRRGGYPAVRGGDYGSEREQGPRDYGSRDYSPRDYVARDYGSRDYGSRYGSRDYGSGEQGARYGREGLSGGYAGPTPRRNEGEDYGRAYAPRAYGRDAVREPARDYERGRSRGVSDDEGVRDYDTDYGRTTSRFYGRSGYEYGRDDYDRDDVREARGEYARRGDDRGERGRGWLDRAADEVRSWFGGEDDDDGPEGRGRAEGMRAGGGHGEGRFRGRGPRNYHRSDERVREEVCDRLTDNEWVDASDVEVNVVAGEVVLTGTVDSRYAKRLAENIAESVAGVVNVQNNLRVHNYQTDAPGAGAATAATPALASDVTAATDPESPSAGDTTATDLSSRAAGRS
ncbi:MAG TPA: BON domain-containing protein [Pyrinomonadaceae bacterium]